MRRLAGRTILSVMETNLPERSAEAPGRKDRPSHRDIGPAAAVGPETATGQDSDRNPRTAVRLPNHWNVTQAEATETYPADRLARTPVRSLT